MIDNDNEELRKKLHTQEARNIKILKCGRDSFPF